MASRLWRKALATELKGEGLEGERLDLALELWEAYNEIGVATGSEDPPLYETCPQCDDCWRGAENRRPDAEWAGVSLPWMGRRYPETRICVVATNLVGWGGKTGHYWICNNKVEALKENRRKGDGKEDKSYMGWATASEVDAICRSLRGERPPSALPEPKNVADAYDDCAFLEAVKCSPLGDRAAPTPAMHDNCPDLLLRRELEILRPSVLVLHGASARGAVEWAVRPELLPEGHPFTRTTIQFAGRIVDVFMLPHPAARLGAAWKAVYPALTQSLLAQPVVSS